MVIIEDRKVKLIDNLLNGKEMPPQKKRVLALGGIAFIVLLFVSFLLSLTEDDSKTPADNGSGNVVEQIPASGQDGSLKLPSSQRYDFENDGNHVGGGLESLLNDAPASPSDQGLNNDPFAGMKGDYSNESTVPGPAPLPTEDDYDETTLAAPQGQSAPQTRPVAEKTMLFCDSYTTVAAAESQKAVLAFQGISASVIKNQDGSHGLQIGPFDKAEEARKTFNDLANKGLLQRCALIKQ